MPKNNEFDVRDLPSWQYMGWGILNGIFLGIAILHKTDISETGIFIQMLEAFKPLLEPLGQMAWLNSLILIIGLIGILSFIGEILIIYSKGWPARIIALSGFLSLLLLVLGVDTLGIILFIVGAFMVIIFPDE